MNAPTSPTGSGTSTGDAGDVRSPRQRVLLSILAEADRPLSTTDLMRVTGQSLGATAHHVRALARRQMIEWAGERRVRGAMQTFYRPTDAGLDALRRPRTEALLTLVGARASFAPDAPAVPALDAQAQRALEELVERVRPEVESIITGAVARAAAPAAA